MRVAQNAAPSAPAATAHLPARQSRELQHQIFKTKEKVFRTKQRLMDLTAALRDGRLGNMLVIRFKDAVGSSFKLASMEYILDGKRVLRRVGNKEERSPGQGVTLNRALAPGAHTLAVRLVYRGDGHGLFPYFEGYTFDLRSSHSFTAKEGRQTRLLVTAHKRGDITTPHSEMLGVKVEVEQLPLGATP